jgi:hypothetical protein
MFCEDPEEIQMVNYLCGIYPSGEEHLIDLMVWCWRHRNKEFLSLLEKHKGFDGLEEQMVRFSEIDYAELVKANAPDVMSIAQLENLNDGLPAIFDAGSSSVFTTENEDCGSICDSCGS